MAIRLRMVDAVRVALCAAKSEAQDDDIYLDDGWHYAISQKYWRDYEEIDIVDKKQFQLMQTLEGVDDVQKTEM